MNSLNRKLQDIQELSQGEQPLVSVLERAGLVNLDKEDTCPDCGKKLPEPVYEYRGNGYSEAVTDCCGNTFISK